MHTGLSIEHYHGAIDGEAIASWLQQLGARLSDFPSEEARTKTLETDELWVLQWQDDRGAHFLLAPTFGELLAFSAMRFPDRLATFS
jgi:hypothetical protein